MNERFYSELISEDFYKMISALRIVKGIKDFEEFVFLFVNSNDCECKFIKERDLTTKTINNDEFVKITNIVVLGFGHWKNFNYTNVHYSFIGIFDTEGKESTINIGHIMLNSIRITGDCYFQIRNITSYNITFVYDQFNEYLKQVTSPIQNTIRHSLKECGEDGYYKLENKLTMDICLEPSSNLAVPWEFERILKNLSKFEQKLSSLLEDTDFDPEISFKIKSSELSFDASF